MQTIWFPIYPLWEELSQRDRDIDEQIRGGKKAHSILLEMDIEGFSLECFVLIFSLRKYLRKKIGNS